jgi:methionine biosynthesis protein MetW
MMKGPLAGKFLNIELNYGRSHILEWCATYFRDHGPGPVQVLDVGCGFCMDLQNIRGIAPCPVTLLGIEVDEQKIRHCRQAGITVFPIDIEREEIPVGDRSLDIVILNQVLEHTKEVFFIFSEMSRVLKPGGLLILGVPNLAAWHNRLLLLLGRQPTSIEVLGPHIRGFTLPSLRRFVETGGFFRVLAARGTHYYGVPLPLSAWLGRLFPGASATIFLLAARTGREGSFIEILGTSPFETNFHTGRRDGDSRGPSGG